MNGQKLNSLASFARRPIVALAGAAICAIVAAFLLCGAIAAHDRIAAADDPVAISDRALVHAFDRSIAEREIQAALAAGDMDLAQALSRWRLNATCRSIRLCPARWNKPVPMRTQLPAPPAALCMGCGPGHPPILQ